MKIAFVHQPVSIISPKNVNSSVEIITYELASHLAKHNDVIVYAKKFHSQKEVESYQSVRYHRISVPLDEWHTIVSSALGKLEAHSGMHALSQAIRKFFFFRNIKRSLNASRWYYYTYALKVARHLRKEKCDIVHIHTFSQFVPIIRAFNPKIKIVLHMHCEWLTQFDFEMIESRLRCTDLIIGVSDYITKKIRLRFPHLAKRCQTLHNAADIKSLGNESRQSALNKNNVKQLLFVGRVSPEKGVHVLIEAFQQVLGQYPQVQLKIVGQQGSLAIETLVALSVDSKEKDLKRFYSGNYISYLKNHLSSSEASQVSFLGVVPHRLLPKLYEESYICVVPSVCNEPGAVPVFEAMAMGCPLIATISGGTPEVVVDGKTGLLVERGNVSALAEAILRLLSDEELRESIAEAGREQVMKFYSWDKYVEKLLHLYKTVCSTED
jgi:glycosyltransferase involved in cell wall biosynthesis